MKLTKLLKNLEYNCSADISKIDISAIEERPEKAADDCLLVLIKKTDGKAIEYKGSNTAPLCIVCESDTVIENPPCPVITVENARSALSFIYREFYGLDLSKVRIIGVTGTNGKTTTATLIKRILEYSGCKTGFIGTGKVEIGNERISPEDYSMTTPDPKYLYKYIKHMIDCGCEYIVMEVSSHAIALGKVDAINFYCAVFTNLSSEHMDFHTDMEEYLSTKAKLFEMCDIGIFNIDDRYVKKAYTDCSCKKISVGIIECADTFITDLEDKGFSGSEYIYRNERCSFKVKLNLPGAFNIYNSLLAICCAISIGIKPCLAKRAISEIKSIEGRAEIIKSSITVIIDYAHTPYAFSEFLRFVKKAADGRSVTAVFGCGGERDKTKRSVIAGIAEKYADKIIVTCDNSRNEPVESIISDIIAGFSSTEKVRIIEDRLCAINSAILEANDSDIVAIIGKGAEKYNIDKDGYHPFDEKEIVKEALENRGQAK